MKKLTDGYITTFKIEPPEVAFALRLVIGLGQFECGVLETQRKPTAKRTNRGTIKRERDADGNPILTDAEQRAKERALHGLNKALSKRSRK